MGLKMERRHFEHWYAQVWMYRALKLDDIPLLPVELSGGGYDMTVKRQIVVNGARHLQVTSFVSQFPFNWGMSLIITTVITT